MTHVWRKEHKNPNRILDKFYTKQEVVKRCLDEVNKLPYRYDCVIEPSAGDGAFYKNIEHETKIGIDIDPQHDEIIKGDWFNYNISEMYKRVLVIGNPPFGQYQKLSAKFISHALSFRNVQTIAFVLPDVYRKHTRQKILPYNWRIVSITELGRDCFMLEGEAYHVPASFFIFDKSEGKDLRVNPNAYTETNDFKFSNKDDFDIFVFGASPKRITKTPTPNNRGYFLKSKIPVEALISKIKAVDWNGNSCANGGVYWLTKFEFLEQYVKCHEPNRTEESQGNLFDLLYCHRFFRPLS